MGERPKMWPRSASAAGHNEYTAGVLVVPAEWWENRTDLARELARELRELADYFEAQGFTEATKVLAQARAALARYGQEVGDG